MRIERIEDLRLLAAPSPPREDPPLHKATEGEQGRDAAARPAAGAGTGGLIPRDGEPSASPCAPGYAEQATGPRELCEADHQRSRPPFGGMAVEEAGRSDGDSVPRGAPATLRSGETSLRSTRPVFAAGSPWLIPPPEEGLTYSIAEVAALLDCAYGTVKRWIARGVHVGRGQLVSGLRSRSDCFGGVGAGRVVKLLSLRAPRGRITPAALCAFLEAVNGCEVAVQREAGR